MKKRGRCGDQSVYTNLFLGDNNWPAIRGAMTKVGYDGWLVAEMEARYRYAPDQQFYDTARAMDRLISGRFCHGHHPETVPGLHAWRGDRRAARGMARSP